MRHTSTLTVLSAMVWVRMEKDHQNAKKCKNVLHIVGLEPLTLGHITSLKKVPAFGCLGYHDLDVL